VIVAPAQPAAASPEANGTKKVTAVLFEWSFDSIARECTRTLGPKGYGFVQVSPPQERIRGSAWWTAYQPVSYQIKGPLGDRAAFKNMVDTCHRAGVKVIVDAVINHMTSGSGTGTAGTVYGKYDYPGTYADADFHRCRRPIGSNYADRSNVQECELGDPGNPSLSDLDTGSDYVRGRLAGYLNDLMALGADGFRVDAVKHVSAHDLGTIRAKLTDPDVYWIQEAIHGAGEAVSPTEYLGTGDVQEFRYTSDLKRVFTNEKLSYLKNFGEAWGYMPSGRSGSMVANHDTERNGSSLSYRDGATYTLAHVFMLAHPYGTPSVHSGYEFAGRDDGAPNGHHVGSCYKDGWSCQHAWSQIANMVGFRNVSEGTGITNWWDNGDNAIAFGRGDKAFVAVNHEGGALTRTFQTSLPAGTYCDVQHGDPLPDGGCTGRTYTVGSDGRFTATVGAKDAVALHVGAMDDKAGQTDTGASFSVHATTVMGQNIYVVGDVPALGSWAPAAALKLDPANYPSWKLRLELPAGTTFAYKYIRKDAAGNVTWESGPNRTATVPPEGMVTLTDTWRP
jgi:alpha-amylase